MRLSLCGGTPEQRTLSRPPVTLFLNLATMGKLNIAHHKSYHPYRLDNIERVRRDEADAKRKQTEDDDRAFVAVRVHLPQVTHDNHNSPQDAESRLGVLRSRAGITPPQS